MTRAKVLEGQHLKTGDQEPDLLVQLIKDNRVPKDLTDVQDIEVHIKEANSNLDTIPIDSNLAGDISIKAATDGKVAYSWQLSDTETEATMVGEFVVIDSNGQQATYPNDGTFKVYIEEDIA